MKSMILNRLTIFLSKSLTHFCQVKIEWITVKHNFYQKQYASFSIFLQRYFKNSDLLVYVLKIRSRKSSYNIKLYFWWIIMVHSHLFSIVYGGKQNYAFWPSYAFWPLLPVPLDLFFPSSLAFSDNTFLHHFFYKVLHNYIKNPTCLFLKK